MKEEKRIDDVLNKLCDPIILKIEGLTFIEAKNRFDLTTDFETSIEVANMKYNKWATNFNLKSKAFKAKFNMVRVLMAEKITAHEYNQYFDRVVLMSFEKYNVHLHAVGNNQEKVKEAYVKGLTIEECALFVKESMKK